MAAFQKFKQETLATRNGAVVTKTSIDTTMVEHGGSVEQDW